MVLGAKPLQGPRTSPKSIHKQTLLESRTQRDTHTRVQCFASQFVACGVTHFPLSLLAPIHGSICCPTTPRDKTRQDKTKSGQSKAITSPSVPNDQMENIFYPLALLEQTFGKALLPTFTPTRYQPTIAAAATSTNTVPSKWTGDRVSLLRYLVGYR